MIKNLGFDMLDGQHYIRLLHYLCPEHCSLAPLQDKNPEVRLARAVEMAVQCQRLPPPVTKRVSESDG